MITKRHQQQYKCVPGNFSSPFGVSGYSGSSPAIGGCGIKPPPSTSSFSRPAAPAFSLPTDVPASFPNSTCGDETSCSARSSMSSGSWDLPSPGGSWRSPTGSGRKLMRVNSRDSGPPATDRADEDEFQPDSRRSRSCQNMQRLNSDGTQRNSCLAMQELHRVSLGDHRRGTCPGKLGQEHVQHGSSAALELLCSMDEDEIDSFVRTPSRDLLPVSEDGRY
eukprot:jgi/Tetstr1/447432/TSEL_003692.t1